ncbi:MAG: hypothetical protein AB1297_01375 [bacterium]
MFLFIIALLFCENPFAYELKKDGFFLNIYEIEKEGIRGDIGKEYKFDNLKGKIELSLRKDKILKASSGIDIEWERAITSFKLAHLNYTDLLDKSILFKIKHNLLPRQIYRKIQGEGNIGFGFLHLPSLYSRWTYGSLPADVYGVFGKIHLFLENNDSPFRGEMTFNARLFGEPFPSSEAEELSKRFMNCEYDEGILSAFSDSTLDYKLGFEKTFGRNNIGFDYKGNFNLCSIFIPEYTQIPLSHGLSSKLELKPKDSFIAQFIVNLPFSVKDISYSMPSESFMNKEILAKLSFGNKDIEIGVSSKYKNFSLSNCFASSKIGFFFEDNVFDKRIGILFSFGIEGEKEPLFRKTDKQVKGILQTQDMSYLQGKGFEETIANLTTPEKVASYVRQFFTYQRNEKYVPQTPEETFNKKGGDCDDQARFVAYTLKRQGYSAYVLTYGARIVTHGITAYKDKGGWNAIEYGKIFYANAEDIDELLSMIEPGWLRYGLFNPDDYKVSEYSQSPTTKMIINWLEGE